MAKLRIKKIKNNQIASFVTTVTLKISINTIGVDIVDKKIGDLNDKKMQNRI